MNLLPALGLGAVTGMRSMMALAFFSDRAEDEKERKDTHPNPALKLLTGPRTVAIFKLMAAGEVIMDKMPFAPARTDAAPLIGRVVLGSLVGAAISKDKWLQGGVVGGVGALAATFAAYYLRKTLHDDRHIPNLLLGVAEDALVAKAANSLVAYYDIS